MITDSGIDELIQPIINIYNQMEMDLIVEIAKRFDTYDKIGGSLEWQLKKLSEVSDLNSTVVKLIAKYSEKSEKEILKMLNAAGFGNLDMELLGEAYSSGLISVDPVKMLKSPAIAATIELSYKELTDTYRLIQTKALESSKQAYMNILNTSYLDVASGFYDYQTSIKRAVGQMAAKGIEGATYRRGNKLVRYSIEGTVRRDTLTAVHQLSNKITMQSCDEMHCDYVETSQHIGARVHPTNPIANHAGWQGKVFKISGKTEEYPNLKESTGYPDDILGLGGVNCRHRMFPFIPGISVPNPIKYDPKENERIYNLTQKQRKLERDIRSLKKQQAAAQAIGDKETVALMKNKLNVKFDEINKFCEQNGLKRDYSRELVSEQIKVKPTVANTSKRGIINSASKSPYSNEKLIYNPDAQYSINIDGYSEEVCKRISEECKSIAELGYKDNKEHLALVNLKTGRTEYTEVGSQYAVGGTKFWEFINKNSGENYAFIHNHNTLSEFSERDLQTLLGDNSVNMFVISRYDGKCFVLERNGEIPATLNFDFLYQNEINQINQKVRNELITAGERTYQRERILVDNVIRDYTKGVKKYG